MADSLHISNRPRRLESRINCSKKQSMIYLVTSASKGFSHKALKCIDAMKQGVSGNAIVGEVVVFLATTAALEIVRRFSKAKCPFIWRALQALQVLCYPPFKWIERWHPFKGIVQQTKKLSRPMLVLSIATVFTDQPDSPEEASNDSREIPESSGSRSQTSSGMLNPNSRSLDEVQEPSTSEEWLLNLHMELKRQGITLPERLNDDELRQFYAVADGDFSKLLSSVKKTIYWRQTYKLLSLQELEPWSHLVYWHGCDIRQRPCLIIRLGLACSNMGSFDRPLFVKAVVSQIEHGMTNLISRDQPQIMVLMDCEGLSPFGFPLHTMKSCAVLLQDHYPNRLACLLITRLPQIARVITQALFQVLKPATQRKVKIVGGDYQKVLSECLESIPLFLGGSCSCENCSKFCPQQNSDAEISSMPSFGGFTVRNSLNMDRRPSTNSHVEMKLPSKTIIITFLVMWVVFLYIMLGMDKEKVSALYRQIHDFATMGV